MRLSVKMAAIPVCWLVLACAAGTLWVGRSHAAGQGIDGADTSAPAAGETTVEVEKILAGLTDEQVRRMLIAELQKDAAGAATPAREALTGPAGFLSSLLRALHSEHEANKTHFTYLWSQIPRVLPDLHRALGTLCPEEAAYCAVRNLFWALLFIGLALAAEVLFRSFFIRTYLTAFQEQNAPQLGNADRLLAGLVRSLPDLLGLVFFCAAAYFMTMVFIWNDAPNTMLFFLAVLVTVAVIRLLAILSRILLSPAVAAFRIMPMESRAAVAAHRLLVGAGGYIVAALMAGVLFLRLGAQRESVLLLQVFFATLLLAASALAVIVFRCRVRDHLIAPAAGSDQNMPWVRKQFAAVWHILALAYLFGLWFLLMKDLADPDVKKSGAFILSFFVVPIWMVADRLAQWVVKNTLSTLKIHQETYVDKAEPAPEVLEQRRKGRELYHKISRLARVAVVAALAIWLAHLWHITIPLVSNLAGVLLDALIILTLALFLWQFISSWIERKIRESTPEDQEEAKEDDEWGGATTRSRAFTLLPMIRKFVGTVLVVMVTMTILSSMGVNIGPLLAGAGVIGLAIGFGAQKLVADVFSGFFYLMDDAFRVGEYITAGAVSGTVETITLRNVMLRHHRGMLMIVPHSELGAITNFMRGGIIVKFNLDFPYDADINQIRKIIKKVGQKMLENEEYGQDFIRPLKSQGVREIANSVMTIRVKFTAKPGSHFIIRREAYRLITAALNAKGIHYAHRKVIVDLPETLSDKAAQDPETLQKLAQSAGAAAMRRVEEEQKSAGATQKTKDDEVLG
jgi:small-conductance mechanosensitive channel